MKSINPASNEMLQEYKEHTPQEVEGFIQSAQQAFLDWSLRGVEERALPMRKLAQLLEAKAEHYACQMTLEMGKPIAEARAEVLKCARTCEFYANQAQEFLKPRFVDAGMAKTYVVYDPLGVILGVMPWNFPFWQVFRFAVPTLMAGNAVLLKHAPNVCGCALEIESLFKEAGFPPSLFQALLVEPPLDHIILHPYVKGVSLTGSERAGMAIGIAAGKALKKSVLELGGSDPFIVLEDVNLEECVANAIKARLINTGQSCIAAKRFIIVKSQYDAFCQKLVYELSNVNLGDPLQEETQIGPLARLDLLEAFDRQVRESIEKGAELLHGGKRLNHPGFFYVPTVLANVKKGMPAYDEETFGPLFTIICVENEEEALRVANDTKFGLGASLWTKNIEKAEKIARQLQAGSVYINAQVVSNPHLPFGGIKHSGYGRELSSEGIREFVNVKAICL